MSKQFLLILIAIVAIFAGLLFFGKRDSTTSNGGNGNVQAALSENKTEEGSTGVTLIEYGDFQCPACRQFFPVISQLKEEYKGKVTFQFRHFPLTEIHQNALISSRAAQAAALQDKFWEMHDLLYENQNAWSTSTNPTPIFEGYAQQIELDVAKFSEDMKSELVNNIVQADRNEAKRLGLSSTPSFILDGKKLEQNPTSLDEFKKVIDDAISQKKS